MAEYTVDDLAHVSGVPSSTLRLYQAKGLLPKPARRGRVAYYDDSHRARLDLIARLQERGFSLAAIKQVVDAWQSGGDLAALLDVEGDVANAFARSRSPMELTADELQEAFEGIELTPEVMTRAVELGLIEFQDGRVRIPDPEALRIGTALVRLGVPSESVLEEYAQLRPVLEGVVARFVTLFDEHLFASLAADGASPQELAEAARRFAELRRLAHDVVALMLDHAIDRAAGERLASEAGGLVDDVREQA